MEWTLLRVKKELQRISEVEDDVFSIPVTINARLTRTLGRVFITPTQISGEYTPKNMEFSKQFLETSSDESVISVIKHEWAHYYITKTTNESHGHDAVFKNLCRRIGAHGTTSIKVEKIVEVKSKYELICSCCGKSVGNYSRKCKTTDATLAGYVTTKCCNEKANLRVNW